MPTKPAKSSKSKKFRITPIQIILCDDVRTEDNGKLIVIGIYTGGITLPKEQVAPDTALIVSIWMIFEANMVGESNVEVELMGPAPNQRLGFVAGVGVSKMGAEGELTALSFKGLPLKISEEGVITIRFRQQGDEDWQIVRKLPVKFI